MIQRIQTVFLLVVVLLQASMLIFPISEFIIQGNQIIVFKATGFISEGIAVEEIYQTNLIFIFISLTVLLPLVSIFLYKRRVIQMRLCVYNLILTLGFQGMLYWFITKIGGQFEGVVSYKFCFIFPVVSSILTYLAFRSIKKDDNLVRSLDRIR